MHLTLTVRGATWGIAGMISLLAAPAGHAQVVGFDAFESPQHLTWAAAWWGVQPANSTYYGTMWSDHTAFGVASGPDGRAAFFAADYSSQPWQSFAPFSVINTWQGGGGNLPLATLDRPWSEYRISFDYRIAGTPEGSSTTQAGWGFTANFGDGTNHAAFSIANLATATTWQHLTLPLDEATLSAVDPDGSGPLPAYPLLEDPRGHNVSTLTWDVGLHTAVLPTGDYFGLMIDNLKMEVIPEPAAYGMGLGLAALVVALVRRRRTA